MNCIIFFRNSDNPGLVVECEVEFTTVAKKEVGSGRYRFFPAKYNVFFMEAIFSYHTPFFLWVRYFSYQVNIFPTRSIFFLPGTPFFLQNCPPSPSDRTSPIARSFEGTCTLCTFPKRNVSLRVPQSRHPVGGKASVSVEKFFPWNSVGKVFPTDHSIGKNIFPSYFIGKTLLRIGNNIFPTRKIPACFSAGWIASIAASCSG